VRVGGDWHVNVRGRGQMDLVRLADSAGACTRQSHIDYLVEVILEVWKNRDKIRGMRLTFEAPFLRHFTARMEPVALREKREEQRGAGKGQVETGLSIFCNEIYFATRLPFSRRLLLRWQLVRSFPVKSGS